jgi:hypothetical protein
LDAEPNRLKLITSASKSSSATDTVAMAFILPQGSLLSFRDSLGSGGLQNWRNVI